MRKIALFCLTLVSACLPKRVEKPEPENLVVTPLPVTARVGDTVKFTATPVKRDTLFLASLWEATNPNVLQLNAATGEGTILTPGESGICVAPYFYYLPLAEDAKTVEPSDRTGIRLLMKHASLIRQCFPRSVTALPRDTTAITKPW